MGVVGLAIFATGATAGFLGARRLLESEALPARVPSAAEGPARQARGYLQQARAAAREVLQRIQLESELAERELLREYLASTGRTEPATSTAPPPRGGGRGTPD